MAQGVLELWKCTGFNYLTSTTSFWATPNGSTTGWVTVKGAGTGENAGAVAEVHLWACPASTTASGDANIEWTLGSTTVGTARLFNIPVSTTNFNNPAPWKLFDGFRLDTDLVLKVNKVSTTNTAVTIFGHLNLLK